jgi:hypothetical protein
VKRQEYTIQTEKHPLPSPKRASHCLSRHVRDTCHIPRLQQHPTTTNHHQQPQTRPENRSTALTRRSRKQVPGACRPHAGQGKTTRPQLVTVRPRDDGESSYGACDRISPVKTHRSDSQNKTINTLSERRKPPRTQGKQPNPSQQYTGSFLPDNRKENTIKLHNPEESEDQNTTEK